MSIFGDFFVKERPVFTGITRGLGGFGFGGSSVPSGPTTVSGGTLVAEGVTSGSYTYYGFTASGALTIAGGSATFDILVVGGGGAGGSAPPGNGSAGGGGGGVAYLPNISLSAGTYPVTVGNGGSGVAFPGQANRGNDSSFATSPNPYYILAKGGGAGFSQGVADSNVPGGSSGGGVPDTTMTATQGPQNSHNPNILNYGNAGAGGGGLGPGGWGGGGGAGGAGAGGSPSATGGPGGNGQPFPAFPAPVVQPLIPSPARPTWTPADGPTGLFAGGGGGGTWNGPQPTGGPGGGGSGDNGTGGSGIPATGDGGTNYTGGGAGGRGPSGSPGYNGGIGVVLIRRTN